MRIKEKNMKKVLSELYYGNINEAEKSVEDLRKSKEYQKYSESLDNQSNIIRTKIFSDKFCQLLR